MDESFASKNKFMSLVQTKIVQTLNDVLFAFCTNGHPDVLEIYNLIFNLCKCIHFKSYKETLKDRIERRIPKI